VIVTGSDGDNVEVIARLDLWGSDEEDARRQVDVQMTQVGNRITVRVLRPNTIHIGIVSTRASRVDFEVRVPPEVSLQLAAASGDMVVSDVIGTVDLETDFGSVEMKEISGTVSAKTSSGDITLIGLSDGGDSTIETDFGVLVLEDIDADSLVAYTDSGDIKAKAITLGGAFNLETNFGRVTVQDVRAGSLAVHSDSGRISVENTELDGALNLETNYGDVTVTSVQAVSYQLKSDSGDLTLDECGGSLDLETGFGNVEVSNAAEAGLTLVTDSGEITFSGSIEGAGFHQVTSGFGTVRLVLPADAAFDLDAETDFGSVETDFAVETTEFGKRRIVGEVNGGGPTLQIRTDSGSIILESSIGDGN
jgi:DUF4097 and DUF4098 domain-containing protein YvlB